MVRWLSDLSYPYLDLEFPIREAGGIYQPNFAEAEGSTFLCGWIMALTMPGVKAATQLIQFDAAGFAVSAGSACSSGTLKASRVLAGFGVPEEEADCTIRVSLGWSTTAQEIERFLSKWLDLAAARSGRAA